GSLIDHVSSKNIFRYVSAAQGTHMVVVPGESETKTGNGFWTDIESQVEGFPIVLIGHVLHWIADRGARAASIANLGNIVQPQPVGNQPSGADTYVMDGQDSAIVLELEQERASHSCLHNCAVVIGG